MTIDILLPVYNGLPWIPEQLRSLQAQTHADWRLWVRDDGSTDDTRATVRAAAAADPRIHLVDEGGERKGALAGFIWLLDHAERIGAGYVMFCDADDVWHPDKIEVTLAAMLAAEAEAGPGVPVLVHTDLAVVDAELRVMDPSFWHFQGIRPERNSLRGLLLQNTVTGCTAMINPALRARATPIPPEAVMHDWWLALVAGAFGRLVPVRRATIEYRQHGRNDTGAKPHARGLAKVGRAAGALRKVGALREGLARAARQAGALGTRFGAELTPAEREMVDSFAGLPGCGPVRRKWRFIVLGMRTHHGVAHDIGYILRA